MSIYNIGNLYKLQSFFFCCRYIFFLLKHKRDQHKHKINEILDPVFCETNASASGFAEAVAIRNEFSRCLSEIFDKVLLLLCSTLEKSSSHVYVLPKSDDMYKK